MDRLDLLAVQGTLKSLLQHHSSKASILQCWAFFIAQLSHPYMTTGKTIALTRQTFVSLANSRKIRKWRGVYKGTIFDLNSLKKTKSDNCFVSNSCNLYTHIHLKHLHLKRGSHNLVSFTSAKFYVLNILTQVSWWTFVIFGNMVVQHFNHEGNLAKWAAGTGLLWRWRNKPHNHSLPWPLKEFSPGVPILTPDQGDLKTGGGHGRGWEDEEGSCVQIMPSRKALNIQKREEHLRAEPWGRAGWGAQRCPQGMSFWTSFLMSPGPFFKPSSYKKGIIYFFFLAALCGMGNLSLPTKDGTHGSSCDRSVES